MVTTSQPKTLKLNVNLAIGNHVTGFSDKKRFTQESRITQYWLRT